MSKILERLARHLMPRLHRAANATDWELNPLAKGRHRNRACPCDSGLKVKRCCGQFAALPEDVAEKVRRVLK